MDWRNLGIMDWGDIGIILAIIFTMFFYLGGLDRFAKILFAELSDIKDSISHISSDLNRRPSGFSEVYLKGIEESANRIERSLDQIEGLLSDPQFTQGHLKGIEESLNRIEGSLSDMKRKD